MGYSDNTSVNINSDDRSSTNAYTPILCPICRVTLNVNDFISNINCPGCKSTISFGTDPDGKRFIKNVRKHVNIYSDRSDI